MTMRLAGKVALITGAAGGIGAAIARRFGCEGAVVFIADVKVAEGEAVAAELSAGGHAAWFVPLDVRSEADWKSALETVVKKAGRLDVLVSNAGLNIRDPIEEMSEASLDCMLAVNVKGAFLGIKQALPLLRRGGGGSILITSSVSGLIGHRYTTEAYVMVKGALTLLARSIAVRYAKDNIRCNSVHPSTVETDFVRAFLRDPQRRAERIGEVPLGRMAGVDDVANAFVYLASDEAAFINGVALPVDGGLSAS
jgi:NAD(P)-dependent dehydrogenase (short-subunit alcohol dehydrogenase family)